MKQGLFWSAVVCVSLKAIAECNFSFILKSYLKLQKEEIEWVSLL